MPIEPANPRYPEGNGFGSRASPRIAIRIRSGDSAKTPELPPKANPGAANGCCQRLTTLYGLGPTGPEMTTRGFCLAVAPCAGAEGVCACDRMPVTARSTSPQHEAAALEIG